MTEQDTDIDAWFDAHPHAMNEAAQEVRAAILRAVPAVRESIKWKAPNFAVDDDFATFTLRRPGILQVILHTGAKPKPGLPAIEVGDLGGRLRWAGHNRAVLTFTSADDVADVLPEFEELVTTWVASGRLGE